MCDSTSHDVRATSSTDLSLSDALVQLKHLVLDNRDFPAEDAAVEVEDHRLRISQRNQLESPLVRLPAELRNSIYGYCLLDDLPTRFRWKYEGWGGAVEALDKGVTVSAGITFACRQIRAETTSMKPVESVTFECRQNTSIINDFVSRCTTAQLAVITSIRITRDKFHSDNNWVPSHYHGFKFLCLFPKLQILTIVLKIHETHYGGPGTGNDFYVTEYTLPYTGESFKESVAPKVRAITASVAVVVEVRYRDHVVLA